MTEKIQTLRDSAAMRWIALLLLAFAMFCSYVFMDILSPIKDLMQSERGWDSTAFGTMQGAETFLNVFVFFLIFSISGLIPLVLNVIIGLMGMKRGSKICRICVFINVAILFVIIIFFASILLYSSSKGITLLS